MRTEPNASYLKHGIPQIRLAGRDYPIPKLTGDRLEQARWAIIESMPKARRFIDAALAGDAQECLDALYDGLYALFLATIHAALAEAHPSLGRDEFASLPIELAEVINSVPVCWAQAGFDIRPLIDDSTEMQEKEPCRISTMTALPPRSLPAV